MARRSKQVQVVQQNSPFVDLSPRHMVYSDPRRAPKPYGFFKFMGDLFMTFLTGGLWLIWIFVREMRRR